MIQDLRIRFGILLATVLLPLVIFLQVHEASSARNQLDKSEVRAAAILVAHQPPPLNATRADALVGQIASKGGNRLTIIDDNQQIIHGKPSEQLIQIIAVKAGSLKNDGELIEYKTSEQRKKYGYLIPAENLDATIAVTKSKISVWDWKELRPFDNILWSLLPWAAGFAAIWFAVDQLIVTHIRKIMQVSTAYSRGDRTSRVGNLVNPPSALRNLGAYFDRMADDLSDREASLVDALDEKETLLREIHHRVKNNLQIIISLLNMQERKLEPDERGFRAISDTKSRINAIALVHRGLYESQDLRYVNMDVFIKRLMDELQTAMAMDAMDVDLEVDVNCDPMEADIAIPIALFFVEGLTNAMKYGVDKGGQITIALQQDGGDLEASVKDDASAGTIRSESMVRGTGSRIIEGIARQLSGQIMRGHLGDKFVLSLSFTLNNSK